MKKLFVLVLALSLVACLAVSASAATIKDVDATDSATATIKLNATVDGGASTKTVYAVDVEWADTAFTYTYVGGNTGEVLTWNPETHQYEVLSGAETGATSGWTDSTATVNVTNHSNAVVTATLTVDEPADGTGNVEFAVTSDDANGASKALRDASEFAFQNYDGADKVTFTVTASGTPTKSFSVAMIVSLSANN
jgi:hypothetical protein